jgi:hypothetical protein
VGTPPDQLLERRLMDDRAAAEMIEETGADWRWEASACDSIWRIERCGRRDGWRAGTHGMPKSSRVIPDSFGFEVGRGDSTGRVVRFCGSILASASQGQIGSIQQALQQQAQTAEVMRAGCARSPEIS